MVETNAKIISIVAILVVIALGLFFTLIGKTKVSPPVVTPPTVTTEEETILANQINSLTEEQLAAISTDLTDFSTATQNDIASDSSIFMYQ